MFFRLSALVLALTTTSKASFCGDSAIPYSLEVLPNGKPVLGCARPSCFGWNQNGKPYSKNASFFVIDQQPDGFMRKGPDSVDPYDSSDFRFYRHEHADCTDAFDSLNCDPSYQWVAGISPIGNVSERLALRCCSFDVLRESIDRGVATLKEGQIVIGGEVTSHGRQAYFDYIADVSKTSENGEVVYEASIRRFTCDPSPSKSRRIPFRAHQATTYEVQGQTIQLGDQESSAIQGTLSEEQSIIEGPQADTNSNVGQYAAPANYPQPAPAGYVQPAPSYAQPAVNAYALPPSNAYAVPPQTYSAPAPAPAQQGYYYPPRPSYYCFTADGEVKLQNGEVRRMDELEVNDYVEQIDSKGAKTYGSVSFWLHRLPKEKAEFIKITMDDGSHIKLTDKHFIFKTSCDRRNQSLSSTISKQAVYAEKVEVGDCLYQLQDSKIVLSEVVSIKTVEEYGIYAPMTASTTIFVNNILASCHSVYKTPGSVTSSYFRGLQEISDLFVGEKNEDNKELPYGLQLATSLLEYVVPENLLKLL